MWKPNLNYVTSLLSLSIFLFFIVSSCIPTTSARALDICNYIRCGKGSCKSTSFLTFECTCNAGWKKLQIASFTWPTCVVPDCNINIDCGATTPTSPLVPLFVPPSLNLSDPCGLVLCGDGVCQTSNENDFSCICNKGSANIMNSPELPCLRQCHIGADCTGPIF